MEFRSKSHHKVKGKKEILPLKSKYFVKWGSGLPTIPQLLSATIPHAAKCLLQYN